MPEDFLPPALRKRVDAANERMEEMRSGGQQAPQEPQSSQEAPQQPPAAPTPPAAPAGDPASQEPRQEQQVDWEARFRSLEGQFTGMRETIRTLQDENGALRDAVAAAEEGRAAPKPDGQGGDDDGGFDISKVLSDEEREDWKDVADIVGRAVKAAQAPLLKRINELEGTTKRTAQSQAQRSRNEMNEFLDRTVPNWEQINGDPAFAKEWLQKVEPMSGQTYKKLVNDAYNLNQGQRVADIFKRFLSETGRAEPESRQDQGGGGAAAPKTLDQFAAPGKGKAAGTPAQPAGDADQTIPLSEYTAFIKDKALNRLRMTREEIAQRTADYDRAYNEGRIDLSK